ncbi:hypothetical protein FHG87_019905 [Trinorchestia longiramus]|nr:hypothetical protein FHG87_019905 [Trinorchestia longiramus]
MEGEDILSLALRRKEDRRKSESSGGSSTNGYSTSIPYAKSSSANFAASLNAGLSRASLTPRKYPSEAVLRIDNFTSSDNSPLSLSPTPTPPRKVEVSELMQVEVGELLQVEVGELLQVEVAELIEVEVGELIEVEVGELIEVEVGELMQVEVGELL